MVHTTLNEALKIKGEAYVVIQLDNTEIVYDNYMEATADRYSAAKNTPEMTEERKKMLGANLEKARATRSERAKEKKAHKEDIKAMKRAENPEAYDAKYKKKLAALEKARAARKAKKENAA